MSTDAEDQGNEQEIEESEPAFENVIEFVEQFLAPVIRRKVTDHPGALSWDPRWWMYPEVVGRLKALHSAYEGAYASLDAAAMSTWWLKHLDPHLALIMDSETGPMSAARSNGEFSGWSALPCEPVPASARAVITAHP